MLKRDNPTKVQTPFHTNPFVVREVNGPMLVLESSSGQIYRRNVHLTRPYYCSDSDVVGGRSDRANAGIGEYTGYDTQMHMSSHHNLSDGWRAGDHAETEIRQRQPRYPGGLVPQLPRTPRTPRANVEQSSPSNGNNDVSILCDNTPELRKSARESKPPKYLEDYVRS